MVLIWWPNWVFIIIIKDSYKGLASYLSFIKYNQVVLLQSSTRVRKYLYPSTVETWFGPQISKCTRSKRQEERLLLFEKGNLFCFAKGQTLQTKSIELHWETVGITWERDDILDLEGWPSLQC